jgi:predicted O-methyltransferase YrrM
MNSVPPDRIYFDRIEGMISADEAALLYRLASRPRAGCIVEIGSWRGKSAIAMALGVKTLPAEKQPRIFCIEPHAAFVGIYGGRFGPSDRAAFFRAMLEADCAESVALVNLPSAAAAKGWQTPIGLLFIDGDHTEAGVQTDVEAWTPHLVAGGIVVFDDAVDDSVGPARVISKMLATGAYKKTDGTGKIVVLRKVLDPARAGSRRARRAGVEDLRGRAERAGYDPKYALSRLRYGSFVSLPRRYMYMETPKAACTSMKRMIVGLEDAAFDENARPYQRETSRDMLIHQRKHVAVPTLLDVSAEDRDAIFSRSGDWFVFALARNPFDRLVSVFENKIRTGEPRYRALEARYGDNGPFADPKVAFAGFVDEVITDKGKREADPHFDGQTHLLLSRLVPYTRVFRFEQIEDMKAALQEHVSRHAADATIDLPRQNSGPGNPWRDYYGERTARAVAEVYADDFREFGYDPDDWRGGRDRIVETDADRRWRAQLVERNAFIDRMFDWMDELRQK